MTYAAEISNDRSIILPEALCRRVHFVPRRTVLIRAEEDHLIIEKGSSREPYDEIRALAEACFSDAAWNEIEQGRADRCV